MSNEAAPLKKVYLNQIELPYTEQGAGIPLIFVHGGLWDYRFWFDQAKLFAPHYRVIT